MCRVGSLDAGRSQYAAASGGSSVEEAKVHKQEIEAKGIYDLLSSYLIRILLANSFRPAWSSGDQGPRHADAGSISPIFNKLDLASASVTFDEEKHVLGSGATILTTPLATVSNTRSGNMLTQMYRFLILLAAVGFKEVPDGAVCSVAEQGIVERAGRPVTLYAHYNELHYFFMLLVEASASKTRMNKHNR